MRELLSKGVVPTTAMMKEGALDPKKFFMGPLSRHPQGIGKRPKEGYWNDIRDDEMWDDDTDVAQAGQAIGGIHDVPSAAALVKSMMDELVATLQSLGRIGGQVPNNPSFDVGKIPDVKPLTLQSFL